MSTNQFGWVEHDSATNAQATATRAAESGRQHVIGSVRASFSGSGNTALLTVKDGSTTLFSLTVHDGGGAVDFPYGVAATVGNAVSAELGAGGAGIDGNVVLHGFTRG